MAPQNTFTPSSGVPLEGTPTSIPSATPIIPIPTSLIGGATASSSETLDQTTGITAESSSPTITPTGLPQSTSTIISSSPITSSSTTGTDSPLPSSTLTGPLTTTDTPPTGTSTDLSTNTFTGTSTASTTETSTAPPTPTTVPPPKPKGGVIAGAVIGALGGLFLIGLAMYIVHRRSRRQGGGRSRFWKYSGAATPLPQAQARGSKKRIHSYEIQQIQPQAGPVPAPVSVQFDPPMDDVGVNRLFDQLDDSIMDHIVNHHLPSSIRAEDLERYITDAALARKGILYHENGLLRNEATRVHMFRAIFAYHIYSMIADMRIFSKTALKRLDQAPRAERGNHRMAMCKELRQSETEREKVVELVYESLETDTEVHILKNGATSDDLRKGSLREIAEKVVGITLQLGCQRDGFIFAFRNTDYSRRTEGDPFEVAFLGTAAVNPQLFDTVKKIGAGNAVRAVVSPGVVRLPAGGEEYIIRKVKVVIA